MKWTGFRFFPPKDWWFGKHWTENHPLAHFIGGIILQLFIIVLAPSLEMYKRLLIVTMMAARREELQLEFTPGYPMYSAIWDTIFVLIGALFIEIIGVIV